MRKTYLVIAGSILIVAGAAMLALPGPGVLVIAAGLAVLASAGVLWAARLLVRARERLPESPDEADDTGFVGHAVHQLDQTIGELEAVERVLEEDHQAREERHRERLVTTQDEYLEGETAAESLRVSHVRDAPDYHNPR